ncbi:MULTISPECIES: hypothetical protein [unclassified Microbacterium]|uniref:hypothetical protein n=1 Tax=Microbacterium TaxID=33882 RepID=UPI003BA3D26F
MNREVVGFVVEAAGEVIYISVDNTSLHVVTQIHDRFPTIDHAVLFAGRASVASKFGVSVESDRRAAAAAAQVLQAPHVIVVHQTGLAHLTEGPDDTERAFVDAGIAGVLDPIPLGQWTRRVKT